MTTVNNITLGTDGKPIASVKATEVKVGGHDVLTQNGGKVTGSIYGSGGRSTLLLMSEPDLVSGSYLALDGKDEPNTAGSFRLEAGEMADGVRKGYMLIGRPDGSLNWCNNPIETIVAQGTNYVRYNSGLQICWGKEGGNEGWLTWNFPIAFSAPPVILMQSQGGTLYSDIVTLGDVSVNMCRYACVRGTDGTTAPFGAYLFAIGRWK